jgi:hypothetical protein
MQLKIASNKGEKRDDLLPFLSHPQYSYFRKVIWSLEEKGGKNEETAVRGKDMDERGHRMKRGRCSF